MEFIKKSSGISNFREIMQTVNRDTTLYRQRITIDVHQDNRPHQFSLSNRFIRLSR